MLAAALLVSSALRGSGNRRTHSTAHYCSFTLILILPFSFALILHSFFFQASFATAIHLLITFNQLWLRTAFLHILLLFQFVRANYALLILLSRQTEICTFYFSELLLQSQKNSRKTPRAKIPGNLPHYNFTKDSH